MVARRRKNAKITKRITNFIVITTLVTLLTAFSSFTASAKKGKSAPSPDDIRDNVNKYLDTKVLKSCASSASSKSGYVMPTNFHKAVHIGKSNPYGGILYSSDNKKFEVDTYKCETRKSVEYYPIGTGSSPKECTQSELASNATELGGKSGLFAVKNIFSKADKYEGYPRVDCDTDGIEAALIVPKGASSVLGTKGVKNRVKNNKFYPLELYAKVTDISRGGTVDEHSVTYSTYPNCKSSDDAQCFIELSANDYGKKISEKITERSLPKVKTNLNDAEKFKLYIDNYSQYCGETSTKTTKDHSSDNQSYQKIHRMHCDSKKKKNPCEAKDYYYRFKSDSGSSSTTNTTGSNNDAGNGVSIFVEPTHEKSDKKTCRNLGSSISKKMAKAYANAMNKYYSDNPDAKVDEFPDEASGVSGTADSSDDSSESTDSEEEEDTCSKKVGAFGWVVCPGGSLLEKLINNVSQLIANAMEFNVLTSGDNSKKFQEAWQKMLIIANIIFAIAFMLMIQSMATKNIGVFSNYDVKKMLPRLIICAVAVNLSFYICAALVDLSNLAGKGVYTLIMSMVTAKNKSFPKSAFDNIVDLAVIILFVLFGLGSIVALFIVYIALLARQIVLTMLIIISPIAFALYLLPNTEQWFKRWYNTFTKLLLVYPMFTAVWALSVFFSNVFNSGNSIILDQLNRVIFTIIPAMSIVPIMNSSSAIMSRMSGIIGGATAVRAARSGLGRVSGGLRGAAGGVIGRSRFNPVRGAARKFGNSNFMQNHDLTRGAGISMANWGMKARADRQAKLNELQSKSVEYAKNDMIDRHFTEDQRKEIAINGSYTDANNNIHKVDTAHQIAAMQEFKGNLNNNELEQFVVNMPSTRDGNGNLRDDVMSVALRQAQTDIISNSEFVSESDAESIVNNVGSPNNSSITNLYNAVAKKGGNMSTDKLAGMSNSDLELFTHAIHNATDATASARAAQSYQNLNNALHNNSNPRIRNKMSEAARNTISQNAPGVASIGQRDASAHMNLSETTNRVNESIRQRRENEQRISELQNRQGQANNTAARSSLQGEINQLKQSNAQIDSSIMNTVNNFRNSVGGNLQNNRYYSQLSDTDRLAAEQIFNTSSPTGLTTEIVDSSRARNEFESRYR